MNFEDPRSSLFFKYVDVLNHIREQNPKVKFLLENVAMKKEWLQTIDSFMNVPHREINSRLFSAQNRQRMYWSNIDFDVPHDQGIKLLDAVLKLKYPPHYQECIYRYRGYIYRDCLKQYSEAVKAFEKAMELADSVAMNVYREEAKQKAYKMFKSTMSCTLPETLEEAEQDDSFYLEVIADVEQIIL